METSVGASQPNISVKIEGVLQKYPIILQFFKFAGIGFLTTAVDFLFLNLISKIFDVNFGLKLGGINAISFAIALVHSYLWNANWTFGSADGISVVKSFFRVVLIGIVGVVGIALAVLGGKAQAAPFYYLMVLAVLLLVEIIIWNGFSLGWFRKVENTIGHTIMAFVLVSVIGALINSGLVSLLTQYWTVTDNLDLNKNIAKVVATFFSLMWNFVGYKVFVFKK